MLNRGTQYQISGNKSYRVLAFKFCILLGIIVHPFIGWSQGQCNNWYFGYKAGITFNTTPPSLITTSNLYNVEGCASISDNSGGILFYTDGVTVYDKTNGLMPNGANLFGHLSSSQSAIIVPKPGTFNALMGRYNNYYIITVDYNAGSSGVGVPGEGTRGVCYSEVDMTLNSGKGDVIVATKNTHLFGTSTTEKITATQHANGCDFWVIGRPVLSTDFYSYQVSSSGINMTPVVSSIPSSNYSPPLNPGVGYMKVSPNSKQLAVINGYDPDPTTAPYECGLFVYDFNNATGVLSPKFFSIGSGGSGAGGAGGAYPYAFGINRLGYGVEFSPNSNLIYTTGLAGNTAVSRTIQQYDLNVATNALFQSSRQTIGTTTTPPPNANNYTACALQLAPDGKVYVALDGNDSISVINNPNVYGLGCNYSDRSVPVGGGARVSKYGLPNFVSSIISPVNKIVMHDSCIINSVRFTLLDTSRIIAYNWSFSPLATPTTTLFTSSSFSASVNFPSSGLYIATLYATYPCHEVIIKDTFNVGPPTFTVSNANICTGQTGTLTANGMFSSYTYSWSPGLSASTGSMVTGNPSATQVYTITARDSKGCATTSTTTIKVNAYPLATVSSINNVACFGGSTGSVTITPSGGAGSGYTVTPSSSVNLPAGTYTFVVSDANSCSTQTTVTITQPAAALSTSVVATNSVLCRGQANGWVTASASNGTPGYTYTWQSNSSTTNVAAGYAAGTYTYNVKDANNCVTLTNTFVISQPSSSLSISSGGQSNVLCNGQSNGSYTVTTAGGTPAYSYTWSPGILSSTNTATGLVAGTYTAMVTDQNNCTASNIFTITEPNVLLATITGTTDAGCNLSDASATVTASGGTTPYTYNWITAGGSFTTSASAIHNLPAGTNTVVVSDASGCSIQLSILITNPPFAVVSSSVTGASCFGAANGAITTTVTGGTPAYTYLWNTGAVTDNLTGIAAGLYTLTVTDMRNCKVTYTTEVVQPANAMNLSVSYTNTSDCYTQGTVTASALVNGGSPSYNYVWQPGNLTTQNITDVPGGNYTLTVTDSKGCSTDTTVMIESPYVPLQLQLAEIITPTCGLAIGSINVVVSGGIPAYTYLWSNGAQTIDLVNISEGNYTLTVTDGKNCQSVITYQLDCQFEIFIPEYFSPNGDGKNDVFEITSITRFPQNMLTIYNRWGSIVYKKENYDNSWDGKPNVSDATGNGILPTGTYYVVLDFGDGKTEAYHGFVQLQY